MATTNTKFCWHLPASFEHDQEFIKRYKQEVFDLQNFGFTKEQCKNQIVRSCALEALEILASNHTTGYHKAPRVNNIRAMALLRRMAKVLEVEGLGL